MPSSASAHPDVSNVLRFASLSSCSILAVSLSLPFCRLTVCLAHDNLHCHSVELLFRHNSVAHQPNFVGPERPSKAKHHLDAPAECPTHKLPFHQVVLFLTIVLRHSLLPMAGSGSIALRPEFVKTGNHCKLVGQYLRQK
jgi:hypothetical protein